MVARQAHNLEVDVFKSILRNQLLTTVSIQIGTVFFYNDISLLGGLYDKNRFL